MTAGRQGGSKRHHLVGLLFVLAMHCPSAEAWNVSIDFEDADPEIVAQSIARQLDLAVRIDEAVDTDRRISMRAIVKDWKMALDLLAVLLEAEVTSTPNGWTLAAPKEAEAEAVVDTQTAD